jgi:predicted RNase H-like HicB family nuclease
VTYSFRVIIEADEDAQGSPAWYAYCPALERQGAATSGTTREEALKHIDEVVQLVVDSMIEHGEVIPVEPTTEGSITVEPRVTVNV